MSELFLRMEKGGCKDMNGICYFVKDDSDNGHWDYCSAPTHFRDTCQKGFMFIRDTIIPQKLALYEEMMEMLKLIRGPKTWSYAQIDPIIDRAKKIEEATQ